MKSSQETCCTETVIFGGKICTVRKFYIVGILEQQSRVCACILLSSQSQNSFFTQVEPGRFYFCAQLRDKQIFACKCESCLHERALMRGNLFLARANSEMQRSGIELACL